ncbi:hypothetical protein ABW19_dt0201916 [Dactylella cylindrospora]|nr:hypothetical protein ABW19_dt0201916 [Dactylella cylindrospora]
MALEWILELYSRNVILALLVLKFGIAVAIWKERVTQPSEPAKTLSLSILELASSTITDWIVLTCAARGLFYLMRVEQGLASFVFMRTALPDRQASFSDNLSASDIQRLAAASLAYRPEISSKEQTIYREFAAKLGRFQERTEEVEMVDPDMRYLLSVAHRGGVGRELLGDSENVVGYEGGVRGV